MAFVCRKWECLHLCNGDREGVSPWNRLGAVVTQYMYNTAHAGDEDKGQGQLKAWKVELKALICQK